MLKCLLPLPLVLLSFAGAAQADCKSDIQSLLKNMENGGPYHVDMSIDASGTKTKMSGDVALPDSMHMKSDAVEIVMTANGVWMAQGGALQKMPSEMEDQIKGMVTQGMNLGQQAIDNAECNGSTEYEGGSYDQYVYDANATFMGIATKSKVVLYVNSDSKPEWAEINGEAMGIKSLTKQHFTFDDSISIADPQ